MVLGDPDETSAATTAFSERLAHLSREREELDRKTQVLRLLLQLLAASEDPAADLSRFANLNSEHRRQIMIAMNTQSVSLSARGPRAENEDRTWTRPDDKGGVYIIADGAGGHDRGSEAAELAIETFAEHLDPGLLTPRRWARHLNDLVALANERVHATKGDADAPATTLAALVLRDGVAYVTSVGDSRVYLQLDGELQLLTHDHSRVQQLCDAGDVLVTDGVTRALDDHEIGRVLQADSDADEAVRRLVAAAEGRTDDNATAIVVDFDGS